MTQIRLMTTDFIKPKIISENQSDQCHLRAYKFQE